MTPKRPREELPADPDALENWKKLPQNPPSRSALPPMTGGLAWNRLLLAGIVVLTVIALIYLLTSGTGS